MKVPKQYGCIKHVYKYRMDNVERQQWDQVQRFVNKAPFFAVRHGNGHHEYWRVGFKSSNGETQLQAACTDRRSKKACNFDVIAANKLAVELAMRLP